jgi:hypothetical protein
MNLKGNFLDKLAGKWLKKQDKFQALKEIGQRGDWKAKAKKCHDKLSVEYKFWIMKADSSGRNLRLKDIVQDVAFVNSIETKSEISSRELQRLDEMMQKYGLK